MQGRTVVGLMGIGVMVLTGGMWFWGQSLVQRIDDEAAKAGVPRMSEREAAERVAREDRFGLPSRLERPPARDIEVFRRVGTNAAPLPPTAEGVAAMLDAYSVSVEPGSKRGRLPRGEVIEAFFTLEGGHIVDMAMPAREGESWEVFATCLVGGVAGAVFDGAPEAPLRVMVTLP